jgi:hypothetical protein
VATTLKSPGLTQSCPRYRSAVKNRRAPRKDRREGGRWAKSCKVRDQGNLTPPSTGTQSGNRHVHVARLKKHYAEMRPLCSEGRLGTCRRRLTRAASASAFDGGEWVTP